MFKRLAIIVTTIFSISITNQLTAQIPDTFENLKVIPNDIGKRELINIMRNFTSSLGVRCNYCHAGKDGMEASPNDLSTIDFASDANPQKDKARVMAKMVRSVNKDHLSKISKRTEKNRIECITCHKGMEKPPGNLEDILYEEIEMSGAEAGFNKYVELKEKYYGGYVYNFTFRSLSWLSNNLIDADKNKDVIKFMELYLDKIDKNSWEANLQIGMAYHGDKNLEDAKKYYEKALEISPDNGRVSWYYNQVKKDIEESK